MPLAALITPPPQPTTHCNTAAVYFLNIGFVLKGSLRPLPGGPLGPFLKKITFIITLEHSSMITIILSQFSPVGINRV